MKQFATRLSKAFVNGIRPKPDSQTNSDLLTVAKNFRPYNEGMRLQQIPEPIVNGAFVLSWPWPQLFFNSTGFWLCAKDQVSLWDTQLQRNSIVETTTTGAFPWSVADFGKFAVAMNGANKLWKDTSSPFYVLAYVNSQVPNGGCCTDFRRGQLLVGDLPTSWYDGDENFIAWSAIGDVNCIPDRKNEAGYMPMDWQGRVLAIKQLGQDKAVVYGEGGVTVIRPYTSPAATWGQDHLKVTGVPWHTAVAGDRMMHGFIDLSFNLWQLDTSLGLTNLGGKEIIQQIVNTISQPVLTYHPRRREWYVSGEEFHFVRTQTGWGGPNYVPISGAAYWKPFPHRSGGMVVVPARSSINPIQEAEFVTDVIDFGRESQKTIQWISVNLDVDDPGSTYYASVYYRYEGRDTWKQSSWYRASPEGFAYVPVAGTRFRIAVKVVAGNMSTCEVDRMQVDWKITDRRFARGTVPENPNAQ